MARYRTSVDSPAPAETVFAYLADFQTVAEWDPGVRSARVLRGEPAEVGTRYFVVAGFLGRSIPMEYEVLESVSPTARHEGRVVLEAHTADFRSYDVITVAPTATGCRVTYDADLALKGVRRPFDPILRMAFKVIGDRARNGLAKAVRTQPVA
jgi:carbon monoxide dehydrogenase subunit G